MFTDTRRIARKPSRRQLAAIDRDITKIATAALVGFQIDIMDIPKVYDAGRRAHETGADIADAVRAAVTRYAQVPR